MAAQAWRVPQRRSIVIATAEAYLNCNVGTSSRVTPQHASRFGFTANGDSIRRRC